MLKEKDQVGEKCCLYPTLLQSKYTYWLFCMPEHAPLEFELLEER